MRRRDFIARRGAVVSLPLAAFAQQPVTRRVGVLIYRSKNDLEAQRLGADIMPHRLTHVITLIATLTTAAVWDATAFAQVGPPWHGSATCTTDALSNTASYHNHEKHTWDIVFPQVPSWTGSFLLYAENWTVTGNGGNSQNSWKTSGGSPGGQLAFRVDINNTLHK